MSEEQQDNAALRAELLDAAKLHLADESTIYQLEHGQAVRVLIERAEAAKQDNAALKARCEVAEGLLRRAPGELFFGTKDTAIDWTADRDEFFAGALLQPEEGE